METHPSSLPPDLVACASTQTYAQIPGTICDLTQRYWLDILGCGIYDA